jgi:PAS domain S-box-containing protein
MFGYGPMGMVGVPFKALVPAELHASFLAERAELGSEAASSRVGRMWEFDALRRDGTSFAMEMRRTALVTARGTFLIGVGREIGERRRVDEARARLTAIIADSDDAIIGKDLNGIIYSWNKGAQTIFGYSAQEMVGDSILRLMPEDRLAEEKEIQARIARGESIQHFETVRKTRDGRLIDVSISISPIRNAAGEIVGASKIARDVTQTRLLEAQLRESQKMEAIGMLASGIAHDFNNILGALLGNVELAEQDMQGHASAMDSLREVRKAGRRARDLVQQILAFGRRQATRREVISLTGVVEESVRMLRATLPARVSLQSTYVNGTPDIMADATQVQQVLLNLGANSVHAMQGKPGFIEVKVEPCDVDDQLARKVAGLHAGHHARVIFSDTGHGMDAATQSRIFEPFFTTKPQGEGTGLGMSVVHGIIRDHEGAIAIHSGPGKGTRIELYFPAAASAAPDETRHAEAPVPHAGGRLLYIDDDEAMVYLVQRMMERRGYHVSGFCDSALALETLRNDPTRYDLAVTDYNMPGLSGTEVAAEILRMRPDLPVALVSGYITDEMRAEAERAGVREVLVKANVAEEFCDAVQRLLQREV